MLLGLTDVIRYVTKGLWGQKHMNCGQCHNNLSKRAKFCPECGARAEAIILDEAPVTKTATAKQYAMDIAQEAGELSKGALNSELERRWQQERRSGRSLQSQFRLSDLL